MPVDATPGGPASNSFATVAEADAYHVARLHNPEWAAASNGDKEAALEWATRVLDRLPWQGSRAGITQLLRWPRYAVYDLDGFYVSSLTIPAFLRDATAELAY